MSRFARRPRAPAPLGEDPGQDRGAPGAGAGELVERLLAWGLAEPQDLLEGLRIGGCSRRNDNFWLEIRGTKTLLVKVPGPGARSSLRREGHFYSLCARDRRCAAVARLLPELRAFRPRDGIVVCKFLNGARTLLEIYRDQGPAPGPRPAGKLGAALGRVHATFRPLAPLLREALPSLPDSGPPPVFDRHRPPPALRCSLHPAQEQLLRIIQSQQDMMRSLDGLAAQWHDETLIHGDVKSDNVLLAGPAGRLYLIDWELLRLGDPAWDLGAALKDQLRYWLVGLPRDPRLAAGERVAGATVSLSALQRAHRALWREYLRAARLPPGAGPPLLRRALAFSALHLVHEAWSQCENVSRPTSLAVLCLQLAANVLASVDRAAATVFGLDLGRMEIHGDQHAKRRIAENGRGGRDRERAELPHRQSGSPGVFPGRAGERAGGSALSPLSAPRRGGAGRRPV